MRITTGSSVDRGSGIERDPRPASAWAVPLVVATLLLIAWLDWGTGSAPVQHLYYLPIILSGIRFRDRGGIASALAATLLYHLANPHVLSLHYEELDILQIVLFLAVGVVTAKLANDAETMRRLAMTDDLTGLHSLRSFEARFAAMIAASRSAHAPLALLVIDVDRLKSLNDGFGHLAGAEAVRTVGHVIARRVPRDAVACRYGGDEFVVAIPHCTASRANAIAQRLLEAVHETTPVLAGIMFPAATLSISVGLVGRSFDHDSADAEGEDAGEAMFRAADAALYSAKAQGRNKVCSA